jgi:hypothetical protein
MADGTGDGTFGTDGGTRLYVESRNPAKSGRHTVRWRDQALSRDPKPISAREPM